MKKNYKWRSSAFMKKLTGGVFAVLMLTGLGSTLNAQVDCTIENLQGGITRGTLSTFATPGNGMAALFNPAGSGDVGDPGCGAFEPFEYFIDSVTIDMGDASLFGQTGGTGTYQYRVTINAVVMDTCMDVGEELFASPILTEVMNDEGFHTLSVPVGLTATDHFFVKVTTVSWDGDPTLAPSTVLWDAEPRDDCRQFVYLNGGADVFEWSNAGFNFGDPETDNNGWITMNVHGNYLDACGGAIICDNFDAYVAGDFMAMQSDGLWTTWSGAPGTGEDAFVSDEFASSAPNAVLLENATTDLVLPFGDLVTGTYRLDMNLYFPTGFGGYFNMMHSFSTDGGPYEWAIDVFFNGDGTGSTQAAGVADVAFDYPEDTWINVHAIVDLDSDLAQMWVNGVMVREWQWSLVNNTGAAGMKKLAVSDFFPAAVDNPRFYMDDVTFNEAEPLGCGFDAIICDKIDEYNAGEMIALQSGGLWTTWSDDPGSAEDAMVTSEISYSGDNSIILELATTDLVLPLGNLTEGSYDFGLMLYFPTGNGGYYNIMHEQDPAGANNEWGIELFFNGDGTGTTTAMGVPDVAFNYSEDMWISAHCIIDLDNDLAQMWVDGNVVREWQWSLTAGNGSAGLNQLGVADFFPAGADNPKYYVDNVYLKDAAPLACPVDSAVICEQFDNYLPNQMVAEQSGGVWTTWSDAPGSAEDAFTSTEQAHSGNNSVILNLNTTDFVLPFGSQTEGSWEFGMQVYVPAGKGGYFNMMQDQEVVLGGTNEWSIDVYFDGDGVGHTRADSAVEISFGYSEDTWIDFHCIVDLDNDLAQMWVDGEIVREWPWSSDVLDGQSAPNIKQLGVADFFPNTTVVDNPMYFIDDVYLIPADHLDAIQELSALKDFKLYPNPNSGTFTISSADFSGSYTIEMIDLAGRVVYSQATEISKNEQKEINTNDLNSGVYILRMIDNSTNEAFTTRVSIQ